jgi:hypothetical protein
MTPKTITRPTGATFRLGRNRPIARGPRLRLSRYLTRAVPLPLPALPIDYSPAADAALQQAYLNDRLGCCVIAGMAHVVGVLTGNANAGVSTIYTSDEIVAQYGAIGGYKPGDPATDQGCDEQTALSYWTEKGFPDAAGNAHKIAGWLAVDGHDIAELQSAVWLFENLVFGIELPDAWINPMPAGDGFVWDVAGDPNPENGHCFVGYGATQSGILIDSWGMEGTITYPAIKKYATTAGSGELYCVISRDGMSKAWGKCPAGVNFTQLVADFDAIGGTVA